MRQFVECNSSLKVSHDTSCCAGVDCLIIYDGEVFWLPIVPKMRKNEYKFFLLDEDVALFSVDDNVFEFECINWAQHIACNNFEKKNIFQVYDQLIAQVSYMSELHSFFNLMCMRSFLVHIKFDGDIFFITI